MIKPLIIFLFVFMNFSSLLAQTQGVISIPISVKLIKGIQVETKQSTLNFGEIILGPSNQLIEENPSNGIRFRVIANPNKPVSISFSDIILLNETSSEHNESQQIMFFPSVMNTGINESYVNPIQIFSGNSYVAENSNGFGVINLWVGGKINITNQNSAGNYRGTFVINLTY